MLSEGYGGIRQIFEVTKEVTSHMVTYFQDVLNKVISGTVANAFSRLINASPFVSLKESIVRNSSRLGFLSRDFYGGTDERNDKDLRKYNDE